MITSTPLGASRETNPSSTTTGNRVSAEGGKSVLLWRRPQHDHPPDSADERALDLAGSGSREERAVDLRRLAIVPMCGRAVGAQSRLRRDDVKLTEDTPEPARVE